MADVADILLWRTLEQPASLDGGRLICVDGPAGSGKTTLATAIALGAAQHGSVRLVHMDDIYQGWDGLEDAMTRVAADLVTPLSAGLPGRFQRYDWEAEQPAEWCEVAPVDLLVLEGVGSAAAAYAEAITTLVWVEAPPELRIERGVGRDGSAVLPEWLAWMTEEDAAFAREGTRRRADVVVDGTGGAEHTIVFV